MNVHYHELKNKIYFFPSKNKNKQNVLKKVPLFYLEQYRTEESFYARMVCVQV